MPVYVRVKDPSTKHEFDVPQGSVLLRKKLVDQVKADRYPPSPIPRPAKHYRKPKGQSSGATTTAPKES